MIKYSGFTGTKAKIQDIVLTCTSEVSDDTSTDADPLALVTLILVFSDDLFNRWKRFVPRHYPVVNRLWHAIASIREKLTI